MSKEMDYRTSAAQTLRLAERATTLADKGRLLLLPGRWLEMADRAHCRALIASLPGQKSQQDLLRKSLWNFSIA